jgi:Family of unknown function (DUF5908)
MPVQINEMVIRAHVREAEEKGNAAASAGSAGSAADPADRDAIVKECVDIILELLNRKNER